MINWFTAWGTFPRQMPKDSVPYDKEKGGEQMSKYHGNEHTKAENDNHSNQLNPNNDAYHSSRGEEEEEDD